ncbi:hypothetical protein HPB50_013061 [Hyalomma asiaticum]|uniref:Uncharacterized protein n=1 Tax=Hyalomma asiaticum TaxID=266040 RepID=A0ACB7SPU3_HYAAI|nr:hypothetical protein HPB50_013061 [Hyalomma asiaticum]
MPFTNDQKAKMVLALGAAHGDKRKAVKVYQTWKCGGCPTLYTILRNYEVLCETGSFARRRRRTGTDVQKSETDILAFFAANTHGSVRDASTEAETSRSSVRRIL